MTMTRNWLIAASATAMALFAQAHAQDNRIEKMNAYIECYNGVNERAFSSIERYQSWVEDMEKGPTGNESNVYGLYTLSDYAVEKCETAVPEAIALEPAMPELDAAAKNFLDALLPLNEKINEANKYYDRENYKDDDFAKGKAMHADLVAAMQTFAEASDTLSEAIDAQGNDAEAHAAQLAEIERQVGKNFDYYLVDLMFQANAAIDVLSQDEFDVEEAKKLVAAYEDAADAYTEYTEKNDDDLPISANFLKRTVEEYRIALKERLRRVRDNEPYSAGEENNLNPSSGWMVKGSTFKVIRAYNELVDDANK